MTARRATTRLKKLVADQSMSPNSILRALPDTILGVSKIKRRRLVNKAWDFFREAQSNVLQTLNDGFWVCPWVSKILFDLDETDKFGQCFMWTYRCNRSHDMCDTCPQREFIATMRSGHIDCSRRWQRRQRRGRLCLRSLGDLCYGIRVRRRPRDRNRTRDLEG